MAFCGHSLATLLASLNQALDDLHKADQAYLRRHEPSEIQQISAAASRVRNYEASILSACQSLGVELPMVLVCAQGTFKVCADGEGGLVVQPYASEYP